MRHLFTLVQLAAWIATASLLGLTATAAAQDAPAADAAAASSPSGGAQDAVAGDEGSEETDEKIPEEPPVPPLVLEADQLKADYEALTQQHDELTARVKDVDDSDRLVLDRQIVDIELAYLELIGKLVTNLLAQEQAELDATALRGLITDRLRTLTPDLVRYIEQSTELVTELRRQRDEAAVAEVMQIEQELEREIYWLDRLYRAYVDNVEHREALGLASEKPAQDLRMWLGERTQLQAARLKLVLQQLKELQARIADQPENTDLGVEKAALEARRKTLTASLSRLVKQMEAVGLDASEQQQLLITSTGEVTSDIFKPEVVLGIVEQFTQQARRWANESGQGLLFKLLIFLIIVAIARAASGLTRSVLRHTLGRSRGQSSQLLQNMTISAISNAVLLLGILVGLSQLGFELGPLLAGLGIAGFVIGFALQDSLANFAAGMMILGYRPFDLGDTIQACGVRGKVHHMSLVNTTILTFDNRTLIIPNNKIWGDVVTNFTDQEQRRVDLMVRIGYDQDLDRCEAVLRDVLAQDERVLDDPPPKVTLNAFGDFAMEIVVRPWTRSENYWSLYWDLTGAIKRRLDAEGIPIAVPQTDVRMLTGPDTSA